MNDLANEIALMVCRQCTRLDNENEIEFSTRLYEVYNSCFDNIENIIKQENEPDEVTRKMIENML